MKKTLLAAMIAAVFFSGCSISVGTYKIEEAPAPAPAPQKEAPEQQKGLEVKGYALPYYV